MKKKKPEVIYDGEDVERCRQVRRDLEKRFKSVDEFFDYCEQFAKGGGIRTTKLRKKAPQTATRSRRGVDAGARR